MIITSGQPSLNPRMVKEADSLQEEGYDVTVIYAYWNDWGSQLDKKLLEYKKWKAVLAGGDPAEKPFLYFISRLVYKFAGFTFHKLGIGYFAESAMARGSYFLTREAKKHKAGLYIGHNLGGLSAAVKAAKKHKVFCGFDAEDFHRNEVNNDKNADDVVLKTYLEDKFIPQLDYLSASSPLISEAYQKLYGKKATTLLNVFPLDPNIAVKAYSPGKPIKLFWFSQTIGPNRGLEKVIKALQILNDHPFELHLLGYLSNERRVDFIDKLIADAPINIYIHKPIPSDDIIAFASQFDIGLATEKSIPYNRDICLTNKLFTYLQAGLAIVAGNTKAQVQFATQNKVACQLYDNNDPASLAGALLYYFENSAELNADKRINFQLTSSTLNWDNEQKKFLQIVRQYV